MTATSAFSEVRLGLEEAREVRALPQLWHPQVQRAEPGVEEPIAIAVAVGGASLGPFVATGANDALHIGFDDQLEDRLGDGAEKVALVMLLKQLGQAHGGLGHRGSLR